MEKESCRAEKKGMNKKALFVFAGIYLFLYCLNYFTPMSFGDDYLYSFIWQGKPMNVPLPEDAARVSSWHDLLVSQWSHYMTWGGRTVAHVIAQFFLWFGKDIFNYFNSFIAIALIAEIYWCIHKGEITFKFESKAVFWIFFCLWAFSPGFSPIFFWLTGACNYLWASVILLGFLLPYMQKYYTLQKENRKQTEAFSLEMFFYGIIAGWTNENTVCWAILILGIFAFSCKKCCKLERWMFCGLAGLLTGYAFLILAPGNFRRMLVEQDGMNWFSMQVITEQLGTLFTIYLFQFFLWYFVLRSRHKLLQIALEQQNLKKETVFITILCVIAFAMSAIMIFSPRFPPRSGFFGTILLIIAAGILLRIQNEYGIVLMPNGAKQFLSCVGIVYLVMTSVITLHHYYVTHSQMQDFLTSLPRASSNIVVNMKPFRKAGSLEERLSGFHILYYNLSTDEKNPSNTAFARYYKIKGIRMIQE